MKLFDLLGQDVLNGDYIKHISVLQVVTDGHNLILLNGKTKEPISFFIYKCDSNDLILRAINNSIKLTKDQIKRFKKINNLSE